MATPDYDALVVGAGFSGICLLYKLRQIGLRVKLIDSAPDFGGTWYYNRYPGAMSDVESHLYRFSWDREDLRTSPWGNRYLSQQEVLAYLNSLADRHDLREHAQFETDLTTAELDEDTNLWKVTTSRGELVVRYLVLGIGALSCKVFPVIEGMETFRGEVYHTGDWPREGVDFRNRRVGVVGCGASGTQVITTLAQEDKIAKLVSFQRTPQYSVPAGNRAISVHERAELNTRWDEIWEQVWNSGLSFGFEESAIPAMSVDEDERRVILQRAWEKGNGLDFMFGTFCDITYDRAANDVVTEFLKEKIHEIVTDPEKARKLTPTEVYARRPVCDSGYYAAFNNPKVDVVALKETPITRITETGITTADGTTHELDIIVLATGFDAIDGGYAAIDIKGRGGHTLADHWKHGAISFLGVAVNGFPNMFTASGPQCPFTNVIASIETGVDFIGSTIDRWRQSSDPEAPIEVTAEAEKAWYARCEALARTSLFHETPNWAFGGNVPGKPYGVRYFFGGMKAYREKLAEVVSRGFDDFKDPPEGLDLSTEKGTTGGKQVVSVSVESVEVVPDGSVP